MEEGEKRGRKGRNEKVLGKRSRKQDSDDDEMMSGDESEGDIEMRVRGSLGKSKRNMTPSQRKISVKKILRDRSASRREGSVPARLEYKPVPESHVRLAKKINSAFKHKIQRTEADREVNTKKPKHLFSGKMSNGTRAWR